ncbi:hypothetical protein DFH08DRAFT_824688 [Mycena albidolilacea]|uniref:Uncharacterized protein n=1 Tax=Mycena albidolilacea TaxID=1033008 RepID=A0AAD6Z404_9AGAR|nr:hypothetical protein DFH08DRAFT_824688 [Mycena albidolilacea]
MYVHNWGLPGINIPAPTTHPTYQPGPTPLSWTRLKFSPIGLYDLRRRLGVLNTEAGIFQRYQKRFLTSDIAWFAAGSSTDGNHIPTSAGFFPEFDALRATLPPGPGGNKARKVLSEQVQTVLFDLATCWDRTFGGTTMIMHVDGTTVPNTPVQPEYLRAATYLPPLFIANNPASHGPIARIVQMFLESVGVPTVQQWWNNVLQRGWPMNQNGPGASANPPSPLLIPLPYVQGSAHYKFSGRAFGALDPPLASAPAAPSTVPLFVIPDDDDDTSLNLMDALERTAYAEAEAHQRLDRIHELEAQVDVLVTQVATLEETAADLEAQLAAMHTPRVLLTSPSHTRAGASIRSQPSTSTRTVLPSTSTRPFTSRRPPPYSLGPTSTRRAQHGPDTRDTLDTVITAHGLNAFRLGIQLVIRVVHPARWHEELLALGIAPEAASALVDQVAQDYK